MSDIETLFEYRLKQAETTLEDARKMLKAGVSPRSVINRAYYSMFYMVLALFLKTNLNLKTSKHSGVISLFDKEFVLTGKIDRIYSKILHSMFDDRQEYDYRELVEVSQDDAVSGVSRAEDFIDAVRNFIVNHS
jgi:uncharacterized protein (UPF0332 family)